ARNRASGLDLGAYATDTYKPLPNVAIGIGVRLERETTDAFGFTPFDPVGERRLASRLLSLGPGGPSGYESTAGDRDGILSRGYCSDPIFEIAGFNCRSNNFGIPIVADLTSLGRLATQRMTQPRTLTAIGGTTLAALYPGATYTDPLTGSILVNIEVLRRNATFQEPQSFRLTNNNLAPRLFASWDPLGDSRTKIFLNWGRYYDKLFLDSVAGEEGPDEIW